MCRCCVNVKCLQVFFTRTRLQFEVLILHSVVFSLISYYVLFQTAIDPGDEVILFDPSYETYQGCVTMAGGVPVSLLCHNIKCCLTVQTCIAMIRKQ